MFLVFSHKLTDIQIQSARNDLDIRNFQYLPEDLQYIWSHIPPYEKDIEPYLKEIINWIEEGVGTKDVVLVQGDFGATYKVVNYCKSKGLKVVYSTTKREAIEEKDEDGIISITHKISHVIFREY